MTYPDYPGANEKLRKPQKDKPPIIVECDGCMEKFDASNYEDISTRHPHYNFKIEEELRKRGKR